MNRRQLFTATGASLGLLLVNTRISIAGLQQLSTSTPESEMKPRFSFGDHSPLEAMYLGVLFTWLELLEDTIDALYEGIAAVDEDPDSGSAKASMLMPLGVWKHLALDTEKISAPSAFATIQEHAQNAFDHLGSAADIISAGVVNGNATAITLGTEHINQATEYVGALIDELAFDRPQRSEIIG